MKNIAATALIPAGCDKKTQKKPSLEWPAIVPEIDKVKMCKSSFLPFETNHFGGTEMKRIKWVSFSSAMLLISVCASSVFGQSNAYDTVVNSGSSANRVDIIFIGDGYQASELETTYVDHIDDTLNHFFASQPLTRYENFFNVHRVNVASAESGADKPLDNHYVDTALNASYSWGGSVERCLYFSTSLANTAVNGALGGTGIDVDIRLGTVNDSKYGGCGGQWGVYAGANGAAPEIALHEIGHSYASLADEYFYNDDHYSGSEPSNWNVTVTPGDGTGTGKWDRWFGYDDPDTDIGPIGYYEGGRYHATGIYRPSDNSKMRALNRPFDAISREKFISEIYDEVDPIDSFLDNSSDLLDPSEIWIDTIDPAVINVEWFVDGVSIGIHGETLDVSSLGLGAGTFEIEARAYDAILDHAFTGSSLDWWRLAPADLEQRVTWNVVSSVPEPGAVTILLLSSLVLIKRRRRQKS